MLINVMVILSLACMLFTLVYILFDRKDRRTPTLVSLISSAFYALFLALTAHNMDSATQQTFLILLLAFVFYTIVAYIIYRHAKQKKEEFNEKFQDFKRQCCEARGETLI